MGECTEGIACMWLSTRRVFVHVQRAAGSSDSDAPPAEAKPALGKGVHHEAPKLKRELLHDRHSNRAGNGAAKARTAVGPGMVSSLTCPAPQ
jgi:hypothetical protein